MSAITVERLAENHIEAFYALHAALGRCFCVAWWVETWEDWSQRSASDNRRLRDDLIAAGTFDGYLAFDGAQAVGWCQALPRDRLKKIGRQFDLPREDGTWAIGCFFIHPEHRRRGIARQLLQALIEDLPRRGARQVEAYPKRVSNAEAGDLWNGPEALFRAFGFETLKDDPLRPVLIRELDQTAG